MKATQCVRRTAVALAVFLFVGVPLHAATLLKEFQSIGVELVEAGGLTYFAAGTPEAGVELWRTDGTVAGTRLVADIALGPRSSHPGRLTAFAGGVYFTADDGVRGRELWKADGSGVAMVRDVAPGPFSSAPQKLTAVGSTLFFSAYEPASGRELWTSDGSEAGTRLVADVWPGPRGSSPGGLAASNGILFFAAHTPQLGRELWKSDADGTRLVADIRRGNGSSSPRELTALGGSLLFTAHDREHGSELWKSDGTSEGTRLIRDVAPGPRSSWPTGLLSVGDTVFFSAADRAHGRELWKSDGKADGTGLVRDIEPGAASSAPASLTAAEGRLFFTAEARKSGRELWTSDAFGTRLVTDIFPGPGSAFPFVHVTTNGFDTYLESLPWARSAPELELPDDLPVEELLGRGPEDLFAQATSPMAAEDGWVFFAPYEPRHGMEPWLSDGTAEATRLLEDMTAGRRSTLVRSLEATASGLLIATRGAAGDTLWIRPRIPTSELSPPAPDVIIEAAQGGLWKGTTGQNRTYEITVSGDTITQLKFGFALSGCTGTLTVTSPVSISDDSFSVSGGFCPTFTTSGSFNAGTEMASGSLSMSATPIPFACGCSGSASTTWTAALNPPTLSINDVTVTEGDTGTLNATFSVSLGRAVSQPVTVNYATADGSTNPATANADYIPTSGTLTFPPGSTLQTIVVPVIGDTIDDAFSETFVVNLSNGSVAIEDAQGLGTIFDNDPTPKISIDDRTVAEGAAINAAFRVFLSNGASTNVTVSYATADDTAKAGAPQATNFDNTGGITIPTSGAATPYPSTINVPSFSGSVTKVTVTLTGLTHSRPSDVSVLLVGPAGQNVVLMSGAGSSFPASNVNLTFDDASFSSLSSFLFSGTYKPTVIGAAPTFPSPAPAGPYGSALSAFVGQNPVGNWTLYVNDALAPNGGTLTSWRLSLTAIAPGDYTATSGTLTFSPGRTQHSIAVPITSDNVAEGTERFFVNLSNASSSATILDTQAVGTIEDPPTAAKIAMYRSYNKSTDYHFFTTDLNSKNFAVGTLGFQDESTPVPFYVWNNQQAGTTPLFRMYNPNLGRHFYTASSGSRDFLMGIGALYEKEEGFVFPLSTSPVPTGATELFLLYNNNSGTHLFTADAGQKDAILSLFQGVWVVHTSVGFVFTAP